MKRDRVTKRTVKLIPVWMPDEMVAGVDLATLKEDSDRSKFTRNAVRERLERLGIKIPEAA